MAGVADERTDEEQRMSGRTLQRRLRVGMLGAGTVGGAVIRLLEEHREEIELRSGCSLVPTKLSNSEWHLLFCMSTFLARS